MTNHTIRALEKKVEKTFHTTEHLVPTIAMWYAAEKIWMDFGGNEVDIHENFPNGLWLCFCDEDSIAEEAYVIMEENTIRNPESLPCPMGRIAEHAL